LIARSASAPVEFLGRAGAAYAEVLETPGQVLNEDDEDTDRNTHA
jgi:hypothetical protein